MNKIYKRVFNQSLGQFVVASENAKGHSKSTTVGTNSKISKVMGSAASAFARYAFSMSAIALSIAAVSAPIQTHAENVFQFGPNANANSYLENTIYSTTETYYHNTSSNINLWEDLDHIKPANEQINVSDLSLASSNWWEGTSSIHGDRNVLMGNGNANYSSSAYAYSQGANNTALLTGNGVTDIRGNNNTIIGSSIEDNMNGYSSSSKISSLLSKQAKYGHLTNDQYEDIIYADWAQTVEQLISQGMTESELNGLDIYQWTDSETGETIWESYNQRFVDQREAEFATMAHVGHSNNLISDHSLAQGNSNAMIGDNQFSGGNNNILTGVGATVLQGDNNVLVGTYTALDKGNNNVLIMSKDAEQSKYVYKSQQMEAVSLRMSSSDSISNNVVEAENQNPNYSGNFEEDYDFLKQRYLNIDNYSTEDIYHPEYLIGSDLENFLEKRAELYQHYGYSVGNSESSILIGSTGSFAADQGIALGQNATVLGVNSLALGANSIAVEDNVIAAGQRKLMHIQDGAADTDLINIRQAGAWSNYMIQSMKPHVDFVESLKPDGPLHPTIRDVTADEVLTIIKPNLDAGTEGVRNDLIDNKLANEVNRAEAEILNALEIKKNAEVAKAQNDIDLDIGSKGSITSELNEAILGYGTIESELSNIANLEAENLVAQGGLKLNDLADSSLQGNSDVITDMFDNAATGLNDFALGGFDILPSKVATDTDDDIHTAEINDLISATVTGNGADGETIITDSLTKSEQEVIGQNAKDNSDGMNLLLTQNFESYQQNALGQYKNDLQSQLNKGVNDAIGNIDNLAKVEDQVMLDDVANIADQADKAWAQQALDNSTAQINDSTKDIIEFASEQDRLLVTNANNHVDVADQAMIEQGVDNLTVKDDAIKAELSQALKDGDQLVANTAIDLANELDTDLENELTSLADTKNQTLLSSLKTVADEGDQVLFQRFDEYLKSAETADVSRIMAEVKAGDENTYRQVVEYADQGDASTLAEAQGYIDQKYGELNDALKNSEDTLNASIASSLATASVPTSNRAGKALIGFGTGHYGGQSAFALGASAMTTSKKFSFGVTASLDTQHENSGSFSVGYYW